MDLGFDGMMRVVWAPTIANIAAPTVAELTAGVDLTPRLLPDGLNTPVDTGEVDTSKMSSTANSARVGRRNFSGLSVKYVRGTEDGDTEVEEALVYGATGYLVVRRDIAYATAIAASQRVEVYPSQCKEPNPDSPGPDALQAVEVGFTNTSEPRGYSNPATVAAGA